MFSTRRETANVSIGRSEETRQEKSAFAVCMFRYQIAKVKMLVIMFLNILWIPAAFTLDQEPLCLSRYDYDYKVLRSIVDLERDLRELKKEMDQQKDTIATQEQAMAQMQTSNKDNVRQLEQRLAAITSGSGSTYVRWGRTTCPGNGTETVYTGYTAGSHYTHSGAAVNYLCLPTDPLWGNFDDGVQNNALIYGAEYEILGSYSERFFGLNLGVNDVSCAVCRSVRESVLMIPGRNACYDGWTMEYNGYLTAGHHAHPAATEFACLDTDPEVIPGGQADKDEKLFYMAESICGALKCPPYVNGRELTCVICTL